MNYKTPIDQEILDRLILSYQFGLEEILTKIKILQKEFSMMHRYNPIEHVKSRVKSVESIYHKLTRKNLDYDILAIKKHIKDIAGVRVVCSFKSDLYRVAGMLIQQPDVNVLEYEDYIEYPKNSGYQSLHLTVEVPVFLSDRTERVSVEIQLRTIAMDFWASLEHKIYYKHRIDEPPKDLVVELKDAAKKVSILDNHMEEIHKKMRELEMLYN
jgi:putative GTP pyrophosphokinase